MSVLNITAPAIAVSAAGGFLLTGTWKYSLLSLASALPADREYHCRRCAAVVPVYARRFTGPIS